LHAQWNALNETVHGQLIATKPLAISCYPGPEHSVSECATVDAGWANAIFQAESPVGLSYPINITCPPLNLTVGQKPDSCTIGTSPRYAVNATSPQDVAATVDFARRHNVRLVIKDTGHDLLGRSTGYGSLEVWVRHLRNGITFEKSYTSSCSKTTWSGSTFTIGGGFTWNDVYPLAQQYNVVVVGGGTPSVGCLGGWMQGGGHGPASRQYGLGADQIVSAEVVLADGLIVTASPCENPDIFFAIRGGGPGTYGVVTSTTIKAWPMVDVQVQDVAIAPLTSNMSALLDAVTILYGAYPDLNDAGYAGYGSWSINQPTPLFSTFAAGYVHGFYTFNQSIAAAHNTFAPTLAKLLPYNMTELFISVSYSTFPNYWTFYHTNSGVEPTVGYPSALGSRLFSRAAVQDNTTALRDMIGVLAGTPEQYTSNNFELVSGGAVFADADEPYSAVLPAWRFSHFNSIVARGWAANASQIEINAIWTDITYVKTAAMKHRAPDTGAYMNEAGRLDPDWKQDFYGAHYPELLEIKNQRDPTGVFYCPTCVGSSAWAQDASGRLCRVSSGS